LPYGELALNEARNDTTGFAPHDLLYIARKGPVADRFADTNDYENLPELLAQAKHRIREAMANIKLVQGKQKLEYDKRHRALDDAKVGDYAFVLLDKHEVRNIKHNKLTWPKWGPFEILAVRDTEVDLAFPPSSRKHPTISRQHIEVLPADEFDRALPEPELIDGEEAWEVECIIGERFYGKGKERQFHIKWQHWPINRAIWEPEWRLREDMDPETLDRMIKEYRESTAKAVEGARKT
jgi:hypothetical protein